MTTGTMLAISSAVQSGERIIMLTETDVHTFKTSRAAHQHPDFQKPHVLLNVRKFLGGLYSTPWKGK